MTNTPKLLAVDIRSYKNIRDVHIDWTDRVALFGPNGAGKTNILEAIALAIGTDASLWQLAGRVVTDAPEPRLLLDGSVDTLEPGAISLLVQQQLDTLVVMPNLAFHPNNGMVGDDAGDFKDTEWPAVQYAAFWRLMGASATGSTWEEAITSCNFPPLVESLLLDAGSAPTVRYTLETVAGLDLAAKTQRSVDYTEAVEDTDGFHVKFSRHFRRYLCINKREVKALAAIRETLPAAFNPLRAWFDQPAAERPAHMDLVELPPTHRVPLEAIWLATPRTSAEANFDLNVAHVRALERVERFIQAASHHLALTALEQPEGGWNPDPGYIVQEVALSETWPTLRQTMPTVSWDHDGDGPGTISFRVPGADFFLGIYDPYALETLSAGERVWADYVIAQGAANMELLARRCAWSRSYLTNHDPWTEEGEALRREFGSLDLRGRTLGKSMGHFYDVLEVVERAHRFDPRFVKDEFRRMMLASFGRAPTLSPIPTQISLYDEPERHLHPLAQRSVAEYLSSMKNVAVATHSPVFLGRTDWQHYQVLPRSRDHTAEVRNFSPASMTAHDELARAVGLTRGELLATIRYVLVVEGPADVEVLRILYGGLLDSAGVLLLPLHGIDEASSLAELAVLGTYIAVPIGLLADHVRVERLDPAWTGPCSKEERALRSLRAEVDKDIELHGIPEEDIVACLDERALQAALPAFPGWNIVHRMRKPQEKLKDAINRATGGHTLNLEVIRSAAREMRERGYPVSPSLEKVVTAVVARAQHDRTA